MKYDPFARGPFPVGVRTIEFRDNSLADLPIPVELWYPATDAHRGQDLDDATRDRFENDPDARRFLGGDLAVGFAGRGIELVELAHAASDRLASS